MKNISRIFVGLSAALAIFTLADTSFAQTRRVRGVVYTKAQVGQVITQAEKRLDNFTEAFDEALDDSNLNGTQREELLVKRAKDLEDAADELRREFDRNDSWEENRDEVLKILDYATDVNQIMKARSWGYATESTWKAVVADLNALAKVYRVPTLGARSYSPAVIRYRETSRPRGNVYTKAAVGNIISRIEERMDRFTKAFDEALDDSNLNNTRREELMTARSKDLENATDELRREFDRRDTWAENLAEVRKCLDFASDVDRMVKARNWGAMTESTWRAVVVELNTLAKVYNLPTVGARSYR